MVGLAAATGSPAQAEDGIAEIAIPAVADVETAVTGALDGAGLPELDLAVSGDPPLALPAVPAQTTAAEPATEGAGAAAPPPEPAAKTPLDPVLPDVEPVAAALVPAVAQTAPTNVNVVVRVDSPGDNGAVTQVNVAAVTGALPPAPQYQPERPQYQPPAPASPLALPLPDPPAPDEPGWSWSWTWDCGGAAPEIVIPAAAATQNWSWNWNWYCNDAKSKEKNSDAKSAPQYQPVVTQYRPININVSIRINSPGDDGPVLQTNVAVAVATPVLAVPVLAAPVPVVLPPPAAPAQSVPAAVESPAQALVPVLFRFDGGLEPAPIQDDLVACCLSAAPEGSSERPATTRPVLDAPQAAGAAGDITAPVRFRAAVEVTLRLARAAERTARAERASRAPVRTVRPAPRRQGGPSRAPALVVNAAGMTPLGASDGRLGYLVLLVAGLAFAIAFADASRSVAAEVRAAGEDPDPPPDHPG